jgi:fructokinase
MANEPIFSPNAVRRPRRQRNQVHFAIGSSATEVHDSVVVPTSNPEVTLAACVDFFAAAEPKFGLIGAMGFACFGPLDLRKESSTHGHILATPKPGWSRANLPAPLRSRFSVPIAINTDVAAAALAEWCLCGGPGRGAQLRVSRLCNGRHGNWGGFRAT